jgi:hypothetical protein
LGFDEDLTKGAAFPELGFLADILGFHLEDLAVTFDFDGDTVAGAGDHAPGHAVSRCRRSG